MAGSDGDLRDFDPELIGRLTRLERRFAQWAYGRWPDENGYYLRAAVPIRWRPSPASSARDAVMAGVAILALLVMLGWGVVVMLLAVAEGAGAIALDQTAAGGDLVIMVGALPLVWIFVRCHHLNRYFLARHGDELRLSPFQPEREVPRFDAEQSPRSQHNRTVTTYARIRDQGDPRVVAPNVVARMTRWEQAHLRLGLKHRLRRVGLGASRYPDDESPVSIARRVAVSAVGSLARRVATRVGLVCLAAFSVLVAEVDLEHEVASPWARAVLFACLAVLLVLSLAWTVRRWQVSRWFSAIED